MECEVINLMEGFITDMTFVGFLTRMCEFMVFVVAFLVEAFAAELTDIRFIAIVDPDVGVEGGRSEEGLKI